MEPIPHTLQLDENLDDQRRTWRIQRTGWVVLGLFVLAGMLGALGGRGPLSQAQFADATGDVLVRHPRFARYVAPEELRITVRAAALQGSTVEVALSRHWIGVFELYGISPQPQGEQLRGDDMVYTFAIAPGQDAQFSFFGRPHHVGRLPGSLQVGNGERLAFSTFVYP